MTKRNELDKIAKEIAQCEECKLGLAPRSFSEVGESGKPVAGEGNPNADIVFIGEAPGRQ